MDMGLESLKARRDKSKLNSCGGMMGDTYPSSSSLDTEWDLAAMENFSTPEIKARVGRT